MPWLCLLTAQAEQSSMICVIVQKQSGNVGIWCQLCLIYTDMSWEKADLRSAVCRRLFWALWEASEGSISGGYICSQDSVAQTGWNCCIGNVSVDVISGPCGVRDVSELIKLFCVVARGACGGLGVQDWAVKRLWIVFLENSDGLWPWIFWFRSVRDLWVLLWLHLWNVVIQVGECPRCMGPRLGCMAYSHTKRMYCS